MLVGEEASLHAVNTVSRLSYQTAIGLSVFIFLSWFKKSLGTLAEQRQL